MSELTVLESANQRTRGFVRSSGIFQILYPLALGGYPFTAGLTVILGIDNRPLAVVFRAVFLALCIIAVSLVLTRRLKIIRGIIWLPIFIFWSLYLFRLVLDTYIDPIELSRDPSEYWLFGVFGALIPMLAFAVRLDAGPSKTALIRTYYFLVLAAILFVFAFYVEVQSGAAKAFEVGRMSIAPMNPIAVGHLGGSLLIMTIFVFYLGVLPKTKSLFLTIFLLSSILGLALLLSAASRGPIIASTISTCVFLASKLSRRTLAFYAVPMLAVLFLGPFLATTIESNSQFRPMQRMQGFEYDESIGLRAQMYRGAFEQFADHPFLGDSIEERTTRFYPHNLILEAFMATGLLGGLSFMVLIALALRQSWRTLRTNDASGWIAMLFLQYLIGSMFSGSLYGSGTMWILMAGVLSKGSSVKLRYYRN